LKKKKKKKKEKHSSSLPLVPKGELGQIRVPVHAHDARGDVLLVQADQEHERAITNDFGLSFFFFSILSFFASRHPQKTKKNKNASSSSSPDRPAQKHARDAKGPPETGHRERKSEDSSADHRGEVVLLKKVSSSVFFFEKVEKEK